MKIEHHWRFLEQLERHEGLSLTTYYCPAGRLTIGYGHNLEAWPVHGLGEGSTITEKEAEALLMDDAERVADELDRRIPWWRELGEARQAVILNMGFNLGIGGLMGFSKMLAACERGHFVRAVKEMGDSRWARQVGRRALELMDQMLNGVWSK